MDENNMLFLELWNANLNLYVALTRRKLTGDLIKSTSNAFANDELRANEQKTAGFNANRVIFVHLTPTRRAAPFVHGTRDVSGTILV